MLHVLEGWASQGLRVTVHEGGNGAVSEPGMNVAPSFRPIGGIPLDGPPSGCEERRLHGIEALNDASLEGAAGRRECHEALGLSNLRDVQDTEGAKPSEGCGGGGKLDVIPPYEDRVDAKGWKHACGIDADHGVVHALELFEKTPVLVGVHHGKVLAKVWGKTPRVSRIDGMGNGPALEVLGFEAMSVAGQHGIVVVPRVKVPRDHELAGGGCLVGLGCLVLRFSQGRDEETGQHGDDGQHHEQLDQ